MNREFDLVFAARLHIYKGVLDFLNVVHEVSKCLPGIRALLIGMGSPDMIAKIHSRILALELAEKITFIPNIDKKKDFLRLLGSAKLNVYPVSESMVSGTIIESLSSGTPIITYHSPIVEKLNSEGLVIITTKNSITDLASGVRAVLGDSDLLDKLSARSIALFRDSYAKDRSEVLLEYTQALSNAYKMQSNKEHGEYPNC